MSKNASAATLALLAGSGYLYYRLYDITLATGQVYHFTDGDIPLNGVTIYVPGGTIGPFNYSTGLTIPRGSLRQQSGMESGTMRLALVPQGDSPNAPVLFNGFSVWQAARLGFFDGAQVRMSKFFASPPTVTGAPVAVSQGAMGYFLGSVQDIEVDRFYVDLTVEDWISLLGSQQMPRNLFSVGCFHQVYDSGCTLLQANFTVNGTISAATDASHFTSNLTQADNYFNLGVIKFNGNITAALAGQTANVSSYKNASGALTIASPLSTAPVSGDTFAVYPGCDRQQATCSGKFSNLVHFSGVPYMPVPETILDGGVDNPPVQTPGAQAGLIIGSSPTGRGNVTGGGYKN